MQKDVLNNELCRELKDHIPANVLKSRNKDLSWKYGYDEKYNVVVISKTGQIGQILDISGLIIALPLEPKECLQRHSDKNEQYWERDPFPKELSKIQSIFQWNEMPSQFKDRWVDYIEQQFDYRENGFWFMKNGAKTYITGSNWMYLQWSSIDVGDPD